MGNTARTAAGRKRLHVVTGRIAGVAKEDERWEAKEEPLASSLCRLGREQLVELAANVEGALGPPGPLVGERRGHRRSLSRRSLSPPGIERRQQRRGQRSPCEPGDYSLLPAMARYCP